MKQINKVGIMLVLCVLLVSSFATIGSSVKKNLDDWEVIINIDEESSGKNDYIKFGEKSDASDGVDQYDIPKCPSPPGGFIRIWIDAQHLSYPYSSAWHEYRSLPHVETSWKIKVYWSSQDGNPTTAILTWNTDSFGYYKQVILVDGGGNFLVDMKKDNSYSFEINSYGLASFEVRCNRNNLQLHLL